MKHSLSLCLALTVSAVFAGNVDLIRNGKSGITILVQDPGNPVTRMAGEELASHLQKRTGAEITIKGPSDTAEPGTIPFYLGLSDQTKRLGVDPSKIKDDGYYLKVTPQYVVIAGRDNPIIQDHVAGHDFVIGNKKYQIYAYGEAGTLNGVYKFLEDQAGIRWYAPGDIGTVIPESKDFIVPEMVKTDAPAFYYRYFYGTYFEQASKDFLYWYRRLCSGLTKQIYINHNYQIIYHKFKDTHPEYFALIDGKRDLSNLSTTNPYGNLCFSNPDVVREFAKMAVEFLKNNPEFEVFPAVPQDGMRRMCECEGCKKLYSPELGENGKFSNGVFTFASNVAKIVEQECPGKKIGTLAYEGHRIPPTIDLPKNLHVRICYEQRNLRNPAKKAEIYSTIDAYYKKGVSLSTWTYPLYDNIPPFRGLPIFYPTLLQEDTRFSRDHGVVGEFIECSYNGGGGDQYIHDMDFHFPGISTPNAYFRMRLLWNPDLDLKKELDEYYTLYYGPAAKEMKLFWETAEKLFCKGYEESPLHQYTKADLEGFYAMLDAADKMAGKDTVYAKRIALIRADMDPFVKPMIQELSFRKIFSVPVVKETVPLEGDLQKSVWKYARKYTLLRKDGREAEKANTTELSAIADSQGIYLNVFAKEPDLSKIVAKTTKHDDADCWLDDCLELWLISKDRTANLQYIVTAGNNVYDVRYQKDVNARADLEWNSPMKTSVTKVAGGLQYRIFLPWEDLREAKGKPGLMFQIYRRRTGGDPKHGDYYSLFPVNDNRNYAPEYFPVVQLFSPDNFLTNGDFEKLDKNGQPIGWDAKGCVVNSGNGKAFRGKNGVSVELKKDWICSESFPVRGDTDYALRAHHRGWSAAVYVLWKDAAGKQVLEPNRPLCFHTEQSSEWIESVWTGRVPETAVSAQVAFRAFEVNPKTKEGIFFDDAEFYSVPVTEGSFLPNGDFEKLDANGFPVGWDKSPIQVNIGNGKASCGKNSVTVAAGKGDWLNSAKFDVKPGTDFRYLVHHRGWGGNIYVLFFDANGTQIAAPYAGCLAAEEWKWSELSGKIPEKAVKASVVLRSFEVNPKTKEGMTVDNTAFLGTRP